MWFVFTVFKSSSVKNKPWLLNLQRQSLLIRKYWDWWWIRIALFHAAFDNSCQDRKFQPRSFKTDGFTLTLDYLLYFLFAPRKCSIKRKKPISSYGNRPAGFATSSKWKCFFRHKKSVQGLLFLSANFCNAILSDQKVILKKKHNKKGEFLKTCSLIIYFDVLKC